MVYDIMNSLLQNYTLLVAQVIFDVVKLVTIMDESIYTSRLIKGLYIRSDGTRVWEGRGEGSEKTFWKCKNAIKSSYIELCDISKAVSNYV